MHSGFNNKGIQLSDITGRVQMVWGLVQFTQQSPQGPRLFLSLSSAILSEVASLQIVP